MDAKERVFNYLKLQNRPFSANDIMLNLHNEFGKTAVQKALDTLTSENKIREKVYGKQKIYSALQEDDGNVDNEEELAQLDSMIEDLTNKLKTSESELKTIEGTLKDLKARPSMEECVKKKEKLEEELKNLKDKVSSLSTQQVVIPAEEKKELQKNNELYLKEYRKRKSICMDILNTILENCPKPKKVLFEEIGIETDEDVGFKLSSDS